MIRGLLDCMPMGAKKVTILPSSAVDALANGETAESKPGAGDGDGDASVEDSKGGAEASADRAEGAAASWRP